MYKQRVIQKRFLLILILTLVVSAVTSTRIYAATDSEVVSNFVKDHGPIQNVNGEWIRPADDSWNRVSNYFSTSNSGGMTAVTAVSSGYQMTYYYKSSDTDAIIASAGLNASLDEASDKIDEAMGQVNITPDTAGASNIMSGLIPVVNVLVGVAVIIIPLLLLLYTGMDILYLAFPMFRSFASDKLESGKSGAMVKQGSNGEPKYRFISDDAVRAYQQCIVDGGNKQPYIKYGLSRAWAYILLATIVVVLITGNYDVFIRAGMNLGEGIIDLVSSIGQV